jgi:hypothetical protein
VAAVELLRALPAAAERRQSTVLEADRPAELERELSDASARAEAVPGGMGSPTSWLCGIALSAACAALILGGARLLRPEGKRDTAPAPPAEAETTVESAPAALLQLTPDERIVRRSEAGVVSFGLRIDGQLVIGHTSTGWACCPDAVVCSTAELEEWLRLRDKQQGSDVKLDVSLVVCTPRQTLAILDYTKGRQEAEGFSLVKLEGPLEGSCEMADAAAPLAAIPGQQLALLCGRSEQDDPNKIVRRFVPLVVERIERAADNAPTMLHCSSPEGVRDVVGSPVFDSSGRVIGCAGVSRQDVNDVPVVPLARLASLIRAQP